MRTPLILAAALLGVLAIVLVGRWLASAPPAAAAPPGPVVEQGRALAIPVQESLAVAAVEEVAPEPTRQLVQDDAPHSEVASNAEFPSAILVHASDRDTGLPLAGVRILVWPVPDEKGFSVRHGETSEESFGRSPVTDTDGHARIAVPDGRAFRIGTQASRHIDVTQQVEPLRAGEERVVELLLVAQRDLLVFGRVVDDGTGAALPDARVCFGTVQQLMQASAPKDASGGSRPTRSSGPHDGRTWIGVDEEGYFEVEAQGSQQLLARVEAPGHAWMPVVLSAGHETRERAREVRMRRAAHVEVDVRTATGAPIEGAQVTLSAKLYDLSTLGGMTEFVFSTSPAVWRGASDALGRCRVEDLPAGVSLTLEARHEDVRARLPEELLLASGEVREVELRLGGGADLWGRARDPDGAAVEGVEVWLVSSPGAGAPCLRSYGMEPVAKRRSGADGRFRFEGVADGSWLVGIDPKGSSFAPSAAAVVVAEGYADREAELVASAELFLRGRVVGPEEQPVQAHLVAVGKQSGCFEDGNSGPDGEFEMGPLVPDTYSIYVAFAQADGSNSWVGGEPVEAQAGSDGLILRVHSGGAVSGRVVQAGSGAGANANVVIAAVDPTGANRSLTMGSTQADGTFSFTNLKPGTYAVAASTAGVTVARSALLNVEPGVNVSGLELRLEPGARLRVLYAGTHDYGQLRVLHEGRCVHADGLQRGTDTTIVVPAGVLTVECAEYRGTTPRTRTVEVAVAVGELADVAFGEGEE